MVVECPVFLGPLFQNLPPVVPGGNPESAVSRHSGYLQEVISLIWLGFIAIKFLITSFCLLPLREYHLTWLQIIVNTFSVSLINWVSCACVMAPAEVPGTFPVAAELWQSPAEGVAWDSLGQLECNQTTGVSWTDPVPLHGTAWLNRDINFHKMFFSNNLKPRVSCQVGLAVGCFSYLW